MTTTAELLQRALELIRSGQSEGAIEAYREALRVDPDLLEARFRLGTLFMLERRLPEAREAFEIILDRRPDFAEAHYNLAGVLKDQGQLECAAAELETAIRLKPALFDAHLALANLHRDRGLLEAAVAGYYTALGCQPRSFDALNNLGTTLRALGRLDEAGAFCARAIQADPARAEAHSNLGLIRHEQRRIDEAIACYRQSIRLRPERSEVHNALGAALQGMGDHQGAVDCFRRAVQLAPQFAVAHCNLGGALRALGKIDEAILCHQEALRLDPRLAAAHNGLGAALHANQQPALAMAAFERAIALKPDYAEALCNVGLLLGEEHQFARALERFDQAEKIQPDLHLAHNSRAAVLLLTGDFAGGWPQYEWRWQMPGAAKRPPDPAWEGEPLDGRTVLLYAEQGLGDALQFIRYAPLVQACGGRVIVLCDKKLIPILSTCPGIDQFTSAYEPLPPFDVHAALLSLPRIFQTDVDSIPPRVPYLSAPPEKVERWRRELAAAGRLRVGINWQGNPSYAGDRRRSMRLAEFSPLAEVEGIRLISLQKGAGIEQLGAAPFAVEDLGSRLDLDDAAFCETAAVIKNLDLVITSDTALAHLAGALAAPVWVALPFAPDWRWLLDRPDSPWYPTMRLFRQSVAGQWHDAFARIAEELRRLAAVARSVRSPPHVT